MLLMPQGNIGADPEWIGKLTTWLQSPQAQGIAGGLLANAGPSMTTPPSFSRGLGEGILKGAQLSQLDREQKETERHNKQRDEFERLKNEIEQSKYQDQVKRREAFEGLLGIGGNAPQQPQQQAGGILQSTGRPIINNPDGSISTENSITVTDPRINGGKPTNIESIVNGQQVDQEAAIQAAAASGKPYQSFNSIKEAVDAAKARSAQLGQSYQQQQAQGGILGMPAQNVPPGTMSGPPPKPGNTQLANGLQVTPKQKMAAAMYSLADKPEKAVEALLGDMSVPELIKLAEFIYPNDIEAQRRFVEEARLKPATEINMNNKVETHKQTKLHDLDIKTIQDAQEAANTSRSGIEYAEEAIRLAQKLEKNGIDPGLVWGKAQEDIANIAASLGSKASKEMLSDLRRLGKISTLMTVDMIPGLGGRPNQMIEAKLLEATPGGPGVPNITSQYLALDAADKFRQAQYWSRFSREYYDKYDTLKGAKEVYDRWLDTNPFIREAKTPTGLAVVKDKKVLESWKDFLYTPQELDDMWSFLNAD